MPLVSLLASITSPEDLALFSHAHSRDHDEIDRALAARGIAPIVLPLDPIALTDGGASWLLRHQQKHFEMNIALGLTGEDMTRLDLRRRDELESFVAINFGEHDSARLALGI